MKNLTEKHGTLYIREVVSVIWSKAPYRDSNEKKNNRPTTLTATMGRRMWSKPIASMQNRVKFAGIANIADDLYIACMGRVLRL